MNEVVLKIYVFLSIIIAATYIILGIKSKKNRLSILCGRYIQQSGWESALHKNVRRTFRRMRKIRLKSVTMFCII